MTLAVLIPYRAPRGSWRHRLAQYTARLWDQVPGVEVIHASDKPWKRGDPFNLPRSVNRARAQTSARRLLVMGADHIPPTRDVIDRIHATLDQAPWMCVYSDTWQYSERATRRILAGSVDPYRTPPDGRRVGVSWGITAYRAEVWDDLGGYDEHFCGWGEEDRAVRLALETLYPGGIAEGEGYVSTLWHPPASREHLPRNRARYGLYQAAAAEGPEAMLRFLHGSPVPVSAPPARGRPRIVLTYARRDEPQSLVDGLLANVPWVDDVVEVQVDREGPWTHEGRRLARQRELIVQRHGYGVWTLWLDPDERLEDRAGDVIRAAVAEAPDDAAFGFRLREMWSPTAYRVDGEWGRKKPRWRLFKLLPGQRFGSAAIHVAPIPRGGQRRTLDINLYHLKMVEPANRHQRAAAFAAVEPDKDWSWLTDETGLRLEEIPSGREYSPLYVPGSYRFEAPR